MATRVDGVSIPAEAEGPLVANTPARRTMLMVAIFLPVIGAVVAWLRHWPGWVRTIATVWSLLIVIAALLLASEVFGPRGQSGTGERVSAEWVQVV